MGARLAAAPLARGRGPQALRLPDARHPGGYEDFQRLAQEVQRDGGDATLIRVQQIENASPGDVLRLFHEPRDREYRQLAARYRQLLQGLDRKSISPRVRDELARLSRDHQFGDLPSVAVEDVKAMLDAGQPVQIIDARPRS